MISDLVERNGQSAGLVIWRPGFGLGSPEFNSSATLVNSQLVRLLPVGILNHIMFELLVH